MEAEEAVRMQVPIVTIGRNMVTAGLIMHIWANPVEKHVGFADLSRYQKSENRIHL